MHEVLHIIVMLGKRCQWFFLSRNPMTASQKVHRCVALHLLSLRRTPMYASLLNLPIEDRHLRALHLELFAMPSTLLRFCNVINID
jgi:hypothetical protein